MPFVEPLFMSIQRGELKVLIDLLERDPAGVNACDETGQTLLHYACSLGQIDIVIYLINRHDCHICEQEQVQLKLDGSLLDTKLTREELYGYTPLHMACLYDQSRVVAELLKKLKAEPNAVNTKDKLGWTALHHAARNGQLEICKLLITHDAKPDTESNCGKVPCHYAAQHGHLQVLKYLYDYVVTKVTPSVVSSTVQSIPTLLHCAACSNQSHVVDYLRQISYPPTARCKRIIDEDRNISRDELAEEVAAVKGYLPLRGTIAAYRMMFEQWIQDIAQDKVTLDRIKLCICGHPRVGKSAMRQSLSRPYLQSLLGKTVEVTDEDNVDRCTFGIEITTMQLSGKDLFSVWDFAGQVESFITHQFFISTQSTVFTVLVDLTKPLEEQRAQLMCWLGFIKMRNLGQVPFTQNPMELEKDIVKMPSGRKDIYRLLPVRSWSVRSHSSNYSGMEEHAATEEMYGSVLQPVPVIIVGSHYDLIPIPDQPAVLTKTQELVNEMKKRFEEYLDISPDLFPLNCLKSVSAEIKLLKDHLCEVRANLLEIQAKYPRVVELVARKIETLRVDQPSIKVLPWEKIRQIVKDEVNPLLSERQLGYVFKCLANAGVLVYFEQGALANFVFIDPGWLCQDVLGKALAPESFSVSQIASIGSAEITEQDLQNKFTEHVDKQHIPIILQLLQHFELCHRVRDKDIFEFPCYIMSPLNKDLWKPEQKFAAYSGRRFECTDETDSFPPGFFCRLQVQVSEYFKQEKPTHFKCGFIIDALTHQCLVTMNEQSTSITLIGRTQKGHSHSCIRLMDHIQTMIAVLIRDMCPTIFLDLKILSSLDLCQHRSNPHQYTIHEVVRAMTVDIMVTNHMTNVRECATNLLYLGDRAYQDSHSGLQMKVAYIPEDTIIKAQELLQDGEKDWRDLARAINLEKYIQLLEGRAPNSTRLLLLKWAEKPKWTVNSLLSALKAIKRDDVYLFIKARFS